MNSDLFKNRIAYQLFVYKNIQIETKNSCRTLLEKQERTHKRRSSMDPNT